MIHRSSITSIIYSHNLKIISIEALPILVDTKINIMSGLGTKSGVKQKRMEESGNKTESMKPEDTRFLDMYYSPYDIWK